MLVVPWSIEPTKISEGCIVGRKRVVYGGKRNSPVYGIIEAGYQKQNREQSIKPRATMLNKRRGDTTCGVSSLRRIGGITDDQGEPEPRQLVQLRLERCED